MLVEIVTVGEFTERHLSGEPAVVDPKTGATLFADGAALGNMNQMYEPPTDPAQLLRAKRRYVAVCLKDETNAFIAFKNSCNELGTYAIQGGLHTAPSPPANAKEQLETGAKRIAALREQLAAIDRELGQLPDEIARREFLETRRRQEQQLKEQLADINSVTL